MADTDKITIDLGELGPRLRERVESGEYSSPSEVIRAGLEALAREEAALDEHLREQVAEALNDPRPDVPMEDVFERLEQKYAALTAAAKREA